jgi:cytochrome c biogenesis protein ResB
MSFDESFLSPRGLLTNSQKEFCCDGPNFSKLQQATQATLNLPYTDGGISIYFTDKGMQEVTQALSKPTIRQTPANLKI